MKTYQCEAYAVERKGDEPDATRAGLNMPVGSIVVAVSGDDGGEISVLAIGPRGAPRVWHPLRVVPLGLGCTLLLGQSLGQAFGAANVANTVVAVIQELPWPKSTLEAIEAVGAA